MSELRPSGTMPKSERDELPWRPVGLAVDGTAEARLYLPSGADTAVVMVGGVGGGFDTPARDLYPRLAEDLSAGGTGTLRVRFRDPRSLGEAVADVRAGVRRLAEEGVVRTALVGHSFGGAVVVRAAIDDPAVVAVVTLATQSHGTERVGELRCPLLLIHGDRDRVLPARCSVDLARRAGDSAAVRILAGSGHDLLEHRDEVREIVGSWLRDRLRMSRDRTDAP